MTAAPESRRLGRVLALGFGALLALLVVFGLVKRHAIANIARNWNDFTDGSALAKALRGPDDLLEFIASHAADVSLVAYRVGDEAHGIFLNADRARPLPSTSYLLLLCDYNRAVAAGELNPGEAVPIANWEAYWLPQTDGGAHERVLAQLRAGKYVVGGKVQLQDIVYAMIRYGDNAAADYIMQRLGREQLTSLPARLGLSHSDPPLPFSGQLLTWENTRQHESARALLARFSGTGRAAYSDEVFRWLDLLHGDPQRRAAERARFADEGLRLTMRDQAALARALFARGTARDYARLMARIERGALPNSAPIVGELQWPLQNPRVREHFEELGTKPGAFPSILTSATFARPRGKPGVRVCALFFEGLPGAVWLELNRSFVHQTFEEMLLSDDVFFERVRQRLTGLVGS